MSKPQNPSTDLRRRLQRRRLRIAALAVATVLLFALLFVQQAFNTLPWVRPDSASETLILYALSTINLLAFLVLLMVLVRNVIKLRQERQQGRLGAKFKTRLVAFFIALSLLPVVFLFIITTSLINRSVEKWFREPTNEMISQARSIEGAYIEGERQGLQRTANTLAHWLAQIESPQRAALLARELDNQQLLLAQIYDQRSALALQQAKPEAADFATAFQKQWQAAAARGVSVMPASANDIYLTARATLPTAGETLVIVQQVSPELALRVNRIKQLEDEYDLLKRDQKLIKNNALLTLALITLLILFIAFWLALYVARSIAVPVQQLAQATERVKQGDLSYRADVVGDDELAALALSFNEMTAELAENRRRLEHSTEELQQSNAALIERRRYIETILQSLSAGVISLDEHNNITTINDAAQRLLRLEEAPATGVALSALLPEEQRDELRRLIRRAARLRSVTREVHFTLANNVPLDAAVTVSALHDPQGQARGTVIVIEDLTELIEAQRRAAWSEVARRMAHEIKNPLTPIRLSAERLAKNLLGETNGSGGAAKSHNGLSARQTELVRECTAMIGTEVATLQRMVDEFSSFARLPHARFEQVSLNEIVQSALKLYDERLDGIQLQSRLATGLPSLLLDAEQIKRVLVNLIDNAAEALNEKQTERRITIETREVVERDTVALIVSDNGPGIPLADRERIFDPYFSTRKRGTGLGLAIVNRIVAEHQGRLRVQDNLPQGARFTIELPLNG